MVEAECLRHSSVGSDHRRRYLLLFEFILPSADSQLKPRPNCKRLGQGKGHDIRESLCMDRTIWKSSISRFNYWSAVFDWSPITTIKTSKSNDLSHWNSLPQGSIDLSFTRTMIIVIIIVVVVVIIITTGFKLLQSRSFYAYR